MVGRITKNPELKSTQSNISFCNFTLAINRQFSDDSGEKQADFIQCVVWRRQAENLVQYISKGALLGIEGRIQTRSYEVEGSMRYVTEVVCDNVQFLESKESNDKPHVEKTPYAPEVEHKEFVPSDPEENLPF